MPIYLQVEGVTGSGTGRYFGWIELLGYDVHLEINELVVRKYTDIASVPLYNIYLRGGRLGKKVVIHSVIEGTKKPVPAVIITELENPELKKWQMAAGRDLVVEALTLRCTDIKNPPAR